MKISHYGNIILILLFSSCNYILSGQDTLKVTKPSYQFKNGLGVVAPDSLFSINFRFRIQARAGYFSRSESDLSPSQFEARIRRLRMRFEGFAYHPKLTYYIQLSFSRGDMDWDVRDNSQYNSSPNVVRDAVLTYKPNHHWSILFGQTKLPGNRQRVISSGEQQFTDRSIVNATFNIDRDFGTQIHYANNFGKFNFAIKGAVSSGEGRNSNISDGGLAYTTKLELLPFGKFTNRGDYFEGDLEREDKPKMSLTAGFHYNENAMRTAGTLGRDLYQSRDLSSFIADFLLKYKGFALSSEYVTRETSNPITLSADLKSTRFVYVGSGFLAQLSYCFKNKVEIAGRYAIITPKSSISALDVQKEETGVGITKYLNKHRIKIQGNLFYLSDKNIETSIYTSKRWNAVFQMELGI